MHRFTGAITGLTGAAILAALCRFGWKQQFGDHFLAVNTMLMLWAPLLVVFLVLRSEPDLFGFGLGESKRTLRLIAVVYVLLLLLFIPLSQIRTFAQSHPMAADATRSVSGYLYFAAAYGLYLFCREFFFRGFLLFGLRRLLGWGAIVVQAAAFALIHARAGVLEIVFAFAAALFLAWIAVRARSFVPGFILVWATSITFDLMVVAAKHFQGR